LLGILDCQHAKQHVWEAGHKVVADKKEVPSWVLPRTKAIMDGKVDQVISGLGQEREHATGTVRTATGQPRDHRLGAQLWRQRSR
jgi:hypothetical protein